MWEFLLDCLWIIWSFIKLVVIGVYSLFQDLYREHKKPSALPPQHGRVAIVTGGSSGIGFHVTKTLCELGMHVIIISSSQKNLEASIKSIKKQIPDAVLEGYEVDLGSIKSVHKFAHHFKSRRLPLHILINNAGVMHIPYKKTVDGIEKQIAVNFMGHFLLSILLLPVLNVSGTNQLFARIVNVSSSTHRVGNIDLTTFTSKGAKPSRYSPYSAYAQSKLAVIMGTYELARRLKAAKCFRVTVNCLHPGLVDTNIHSKAVFPAPLLRRIIGRFYKTPIQGADTVLYVALSPDLEKQTGGYYENSQKAASSKKSQSFQVQQAIWHTTCSVLNIDPHDLPSSRSHELMSSTGLAFSWHEDYINSPYQTSVTGSPDKKPAVISPDKPTSPVKIGEGWKRPGDSCIVDFEKDGEPGPQENVRSSSLEMPDLPEKPKIPMKPPPPPRKSDLNASPELEKEVIVAVRGRSGSTSSEPIPCIENVGEYIRASRKDSAPDIFISMYQSEDHPDLDPEESNNLDCEEFMSRPSIYNSPHSDKQSRKLQPIRCGNDIIYVPEDLDSLSCSASQSEKSSPVASFISMEEGDLTSSIRSTRSGSSGRVPCIQLNESMLESLQGESEMTSEGSEFMFENELNPNVRCKSASLENSPLKSETSADTSQASERSSPCSSRVSPSISREDRPFDLSGLENKDPSLKDLTSNGQDSDGFKNRHGSHPIRDSSDDELDDDLIITTDLGPIRKSSRPISPSISDDDEARETRQERGRTMVRRCSKVVASDIADPTKDKESDEDEDDRNSGLPYPGMTNITITLDNSVNAASPKDSPGRITPYQDEMILDFVSGVITESIKLVQKSKSPVEMSPSHESLLNISGSPSRRSAAGAGGSPTSVDQEIRSFMKNENKKFQDSKNFGPPVASPNPEQKSNPFAQKGWDRLPHDVSDAELKAFAEHSYLYNEMIRSGRVTPVKIQLDTVREESILESDGSPNKNSNPQTATPPKTLPKPSRKPPGVESSQSNQAKEADQLSPQLEILIRDFEEKLFEFEAKAPSSPQNNYPKSNQSDSDSTIVNSASQGDGSSCGSRPEEIEKRESFSSGDEPQEEIESQHLPPGIGISHIFFSPDVSPVSPKTPEDLMFMFQLPEKDYKKASIVELNDTEQPNPNDILQGIPLLEDNDDDDDDDEGFRGTFAREQEYTFQFKPKLNETSPKIHKEPTTMTSDNDDKGSSGNAPPIAKKPARPSGDAQAAGKLPPVAKKPVRPQQSPPPVPQKPGKQNSIPKFSEKSTPESSPEKGVNINTSVNFDSQGEHLGSPGVAREPEAFCKLDKSPQKQEKVLIESEESSIPEKHRENPEEKPLKSPVKNPESPVQRSSSPTTDAASPLKSPVNPESEAVNPVTQAANAVVTPVKQLRMTGSHVEKPENLAKAATASVGIKIPDSPMRQVISPQEETCSSTKQETSPVKLLESPIRKVIKPVEELPIPERQATSPAKEAQSPARQATSPVKELHSPARQATSPVKEPQSPARQATSPIKEPQSPARQATSPVKEPHSPARQVTSPIKEPHSPARQATSPVKELQSPARQATSPVKELHSPARQATSPIKEPHSPARQATSPVKEPQSPARQATSPIKEPHSLARQATSPVKEPHSPARQVTSPIKEPHSPARQVTSPIKEPHSPVRQATSPVKEQQSSARQAPISPKVLDSPVREQQQSSMKQVTNPIKPSGIPVRMPSTSPINKSLSPSEGLDMSTGQLSSPQKQALDPLRPDSPSSLTPEQNKLESDCSATHTGSSPKSETESDPPSSPDRDMAATHDPTDKDLRVDSPRKMSPISKTRELLAKENRSSVDLTDLTDASEASTLSAYAMAMSSIDSDDCWFDSQPYSNEREESDYAQIMAAYKSRSSPAKKESPEDDETASNTTLHSEVLSSHSGSKSDDEEDNQNDSQSNC